MRHLTRQADIEFSLGRLRFRLSCSTSVHQLRVINHDRDGFVELARPFRRVLRGDRGGGGIGRATAVSFASAGARVAAVDRRRTRA